LKQFYIGEYSVKNDTSKQTYH